MFPNMEQYTNATFYNRERGDEMVEKKLDENYWTGTAPQLLCRACGLSEVDYELDQRHPRKPMGEFARSSQSLPVG